MTALDGFHTTTDVSDGSFTIPLNKPQVGITAPGNGSLQRPGQPVALYGAAYDVNDGPLPEAAYEWRSDRDGALGTGQQLEALLSRGRHVITLEARDRHGDAASASIVVNVTEGGLYLPLIHSK